MKSTDDINYDYIRIETAIDFLMEKLKSLDEEYEIAFQRETKIKETIRQSKKREVYEKGKLVIK